MLGTTEYVEWIEGITKTRQGSLHKLERMVAQKAFAVGSPKCPVVLLEKMIAKRLTSLKIQAHFTKPSGGYSVDSLKH